MKEGPLKFRGLVTYDCARSQAGAGNETFHRAITKEPPPYSNPGPRFFNHASHSRNPGQISSTIAQNLRE